MLNVGIIGFGKMGKIRANAITSNGKGRVVSVFDNNPRTDSLGYNMAKSAEGIVNDPKIDAIFICTPNYLNKPLTVAGLKTGKHVFCEKPPALNTLEVEQIREIKKDSGFDVVVEENNIITMRLRSK